MRNSQSSKHNFLVDEIVNVKVRDWTSKGDIRSTVLKARVAELVKTPFGYDVELSKMLTFTGNFPLPQLSEPDIQYDTSGKLVRMKKIFVRDFDIQPVLSSLRAALTNIFETFQFRHISSLKNAPGKPDNIEYIKYWKSDGSCEILEDDTISVISDPEHHLRLAYKISHFFGFAKARGQSMTINLKSDSVHLTSNLYSELDVYEGLIWKNPATCVTYRPKIGSLVCGPVSQYRSKDKAPSYDNWFVSSKQFELLVFLILDNTGRHDERTQKNNIQKLIIPENKENYFVHQESIFSRYAYAAIYLLVVCDTKILPATWQLPVRKLPGSNETLPFEKWWPQIVFEKSQNRSPGR